jgi:DNA-binding LacI/PurR family transcriptional regulator
MGNATMLDVAKQAGVSVATVSRVLNGSDRVSEETRQKVMKVCESMDYTLNPIAQSLRLGKTNSVAAILPFLTLPSIVERLRGVMASLSENDFELVPFTLGNPEDRDAKIMELSRRSKTDGLLIISMPVNKEQGDLLIRNKMPTVLIDSQHPKLDRINVDDRCGGKLVTDYLIGLGHKKIGFISSHLNNPLQFSSTIYRYQGYCDALKEAKLPINPNYQEEGKHGREEAKRMALKMLSSDDPPTAIFASSDSKAIGVLDAARELNISVPEDLSVVGYDDIRDAEYVNLTTVHQPLFKAGRLGGRKLVSLIKNPGSTPEEVLLPLELVVRGTTAPPSV